MNFFFNSRRRKTPEQRQSKEKAPPPAPPVSDLDRDEYSTVDECASILSRAALAPETLSAGSAAAAPGRQDASFIMVECDLYSEPADALGGASSNALPDISPYACFYGAPKHQVLKVGWLDKLSPQG